MKEVKSITTPIGMGLYCHNYLIKNGRHFVEIKDKGKNVIFKAEVKCTND